MCAEQRASSRGCGCVGAEGQVLPSEEAFWDLILADQFLNTKSLDVRVQASVCVYVYVRVCVLWGSRSI